MGRRCYSVGVRRPTVFLFDIDGTLISSGSAGRRAVEAAFAASHGRAEACSDFSFAGMTDRAIVRRALAGMGAASDDAAVDALLDTYLSLLADEVARAGDYRVHAGIAEALDALEPHARRGVAAVGLGTGNVERGARLKLGRVGLAGRFSFGGYGSDAEERPELIRIGAQRGAAHLGRERASCRVVIIGDTPRDIEAAHAIGAEAIAVATGPFSVLELQNAGADRAFDNLSAPGALEALLG